MGISESLPTTSYMKWIDLWMMFSIIMPFLEVLAQAGHYMLKGQIIEYFLAVILILRFKDLCGTNYGQTWTASEVNGVTRKSILKPEAA